MPTLTSVTVHAPAAQCPSGPGSGRGPHRLCRWLCWCRQGSTEAWAFALRTGHCRARLPFPPLRGCRGTRQGPRSMSVLGITTHLSNLASLGCGHPAPQIVTPHQSLGQDSLGSQGPSPGHLPQVPFPGHELHPYLGYVVALTGPCTLSRARCVTRPDTGHLPRLQPQLVQGGARDKVAGPRASGETGFFPLGKPAVGR